MKSMRDTIKVIEQTVAKTLPAGNTFELLEEPLTLKDRHILRVITPSWSRMDKMERFSKMQDAILPELTPQERKRIFRISVLTPDEWQEIKKDRPKAKLVSHGAIKGKPRPKPTTALGKTIAVRKQKPIAG